MRDSHPNEPSRRHHCHARLAPSLELTSVAHECQFGRRKVAVKVVDIFGNDTMTIVEVNAGGRA